jgi:hypothetical protein
MVIFSVYIIWKKFHPPRLQISYISCHILQQYNFAFLIVPVYYPYKKNSGIELISIIVYLHIDIFLLHTSPFQPVVQGGIVYCKKPL